MKILHLNTSDIKGGAARAAYRLHQGLQGIGLASQILVREKSSADETVIQENTILTKLGPRMNNLPLGLYQNRDHQMFATQWSPDTLAHRINRINPDIIHLHWVCNGYLQIETLAQFNKPLVWTLHDMWPFTGGCLYSHTCDQYMKSCGNCPQLRSHRNFDLSRWVWRRKFKSWSGLNLSIVSPSRWLAECATSSSIFQEFYVEVIPHGLPLDKYKPIQQHLARELLELPQDKKIILFGAESGVTNDARKGFQFLLPALHHLSESGWQNKAELVVFGTSQPKNPIDLGFKVSYQGRFHDDISLALIYSAADVMVVPSTQEAFGQTASESLACGTPVVAFDATGLRDIVDHQQNGYLAKPFESEDLAHGIEWVLQDINRYYELRKNAREKATHEFTLTKQAQRYSNLYQEILD